MTVNEEPTGLIVMIPNVEQVPVHVESLNVLPIIQPGTPLTLVSVEPPAIRLSTFVTSPRLRLTANLVTGYKREMSL
jgi:hypothetical protein